ncbi:hypothetical protein [Planctomonas deserti]|uniref:hypothetical protein n=1 Tax=Planctomonas deserti TaxID=2144185 RepID=UPI00131F2C06|nr:hypothetical protein [Planctomonas deserti]
MTTLPPITRIRRSLVGALSVLGIVLASAIGLHEWADDAVISSVSHSAAGSPADESFGA